jgi:hypothetical protein
MISLQENGKQKKTKRKYEIAQKTQLFRTKENANFYARPFLFRS